MVIQYKRTTSVHTMSQKSIEDTSDDENGDSSDQKTTDVKEPSKGEEPDDYEEDDERYDYLVYAVGVAVLAAAIMIFAMKSHLLPQTSTTFTIQPVIDLTKYKTGYNDDIFDSKADYEKSPSFLQQDLHAVGAVKYRLGCYGPTEPLKRANIEGVYKWISLTNDQLMMRTITPISVCTCIDEHVLLAFGADTFRENVLGVFMPMTLAQTIDKYQSFVNSSMYSPQTEEMQSLHRDQYRMTGNLPLHLINDEQYEKLRDMRAWCVKTAAPVYTMHVASVWNIKTLLLIGLAFVVVGLDLLGTRHFSNDEGYEHWHLVWLFDLGPIAALLVNLMWWERQTDLRQQDSQYSFLKVFVYGLLVVCLLVLVIFSVWANVYKKRQQRFNPMWERIFVDVPMIVGLAIVGFALKLQNDEHDETVLLCTMLLLLAGGLVQHISNLVKEVYDLVCSRFQEKLLNALQSGQSFVDTKADAARLARTRYIMQHFGWTRVYAFVIVVFTAIGSWTVSSTTSGSHNPLLFITGNQYLYFILAYILALAGLDMFFEAIPFVTNKDNMYGEAAANRLRKLVVSAWILFLLVSQAAVENSES